MSMWEPFSAGARYSMVNAQQEAQRHGDAYIAPHHILLGVLLQSDEPAARVLIDRGLTIDLARAQLEPARTGKPADEMIFTPRAKQSIELAFETAREYNHRYMGVEHLLCGVIRSKDPTVLQIFAAANIDSEAIRMQIMETAKPNEQPRPDDSFGEQLTSQVQHLDATLRKYAGNLSGYVHLREAVATLHSTISELMKQEGWD